LDYSRQQETGKAASATSSSGVAATPGVFPQSQPSPPLLLSSQSGGTISGNSIPPTPSTDIKNPGLGMADVKEECKTPIGLSSMSSTGTLGSIPSTPSAGGLGASSSGLGSMPSSGGLGAMSSGGAGSGSLGFSLSLDKDDTKVCEWLNCRHSCLMCLILPYDGLQLLRYFLPAAF